MTDAQVIAFIKEQVYGWVGNLMRDLDAQDVEVTPELVARALKAVAVLVERTPTNEDFDEFLSDLNDGRGSE